MAEPFIAVPSYFVPSGVDPSGLYPRATVAQLSAAQPPQESPRPLSETRRGIAAEDAAGQRPYDLAVQDTVAEDADVAADDGRDTQVDGDGLDAAADRLRLDVSALGPLAPFADGAGVTDLFVNGAAGLWVDSGRGPVRHPGWTSTEPALRALATSLIARGGRHIDEATPCVDVRLADGIRVHAVLPPASSAGTLLSIRLPAPHRPSFTALVAAGLCGADGGEGEVGEASVVAKRLRRAVAGRENVLITGAAGSGKTTLLAALLAEAPHGERIVVIEDVAELRIDHPHVVALECRQPNLEGAGRLGLDALLREALRMRPDRLVLGECRGGEIRELLGALNTGHDGGAGTLHANSLTDVPARLEALGALAGLGPEAVARQTISAIALVVHLEQSGGLRRVRALGQFALDSRDRLVVVVAALPSSPLAGPGLGRTGSARHAIGGGR